MKKVIAILLMLALLVPISCAGEKAAPRQHLFIGGSSAGSSWHMCSVATANIWNQAIPEVTVTPVEGAGAGGGSTGNTIDVEEGALDIAGVWEIGSGIGAEVAKVPPLGERPVKNGWRTLFIYGPPSCYNLLARADSGIKTVADMNGRKWTGRAGSGDTVKTIDALEIAGIKPKEVVYGGYPECVAAMKEGKAEVYIKSTGGFTVDATVLDILTVTKLVWLSWPQELADKVTKSGKLPVATFHRVPAGIAGTSFPGHPEILTMGGLGGAGPATLEGTISQELGYKMAKAIFERYEDLHLVFPASKDLVEMYGGDPIKATIGEAQKINELFYDRFQKFHPGYSMCPLHSGTVQYFKEKGYDVPAILIPPEYKG